MEPLRQCQIATHFKKVNDSEGVNGYFYMPCKANDRKAEKKTLMDIGSEELKCPDVVVQDFQTIIGRGGGATVSPSELVRFEKWTAQFGSDGSG